MKLLSILLCTLSCLIVSASESSALVEWRSIHKPIESNNGVVASQEARASKIAADILKQGGNAVDAAVALGFAKAVTLPRAGNLGGGGFMLIYLAEHDKTIAIDYREKAPIDSTRTMFLDKEQNVDRGRAMFSSLASGVPGTPAGLLYALEKYGTMSREQVMQPAIELARAGIRASTAMVDGLKARKSRLISDPEVARIYYKPDGSIYQPGEKIVFKDLAKTLEIIAKQGVDGFYRGEVADKIVNFMKNNGGLIRHQDLARYRAIEREAIVGEFNGYRVLSMPPPSSGGVHIIQALNVLKNFDLKQMGWGSAEYLSTVAEVLKFVYADRSRHLGDPDFHTVPFTELMSQEYANSIAKKIKKRGVTPSSEIAPASFKNNESPQTTHYSVVDSKGNAVSNTYTLNFSYGSGKIVPGTGMFLNNEMDDFSAKPGTPNAYGLIGGEANAIEPEKRPLSSMTPTIVLNKDGFPILVTGSPGGSRIITAVLQQLLNVLEFNMNLAEAANLPRFHHQWLPDVLRLENGFSPDTITLLEAKGYEINISNASGSVQSVGYDGKKFYGASDPRRGGAKAIGIMKNGFIID